MHLLPRKGSFESLYYALDLNAPNCSGSALLKEAQDKAAATKGASRKGSESALPKHAIFVAVNGDDESNDGTEANPFQSIQRAIDVAAANAVGVESADEVPTVILRGGTHFLSGASDFMFAILKSPMSHFYSHSHSHSFSCLVSSRLVSSRLLSSPLLSLRLWTETVQIGPQHSNLLVRAYPGESPVVSGGKPLKVSWKAFNTSGGANIYVSDISGQVPNMPGLQLDGVRATRARYPNLPGGIEVTQTIPCLCVCECVCVCVFLWLSLSSSVSPHVVAVLSLSFVF